MLSNPSEPVAAVAANRRGMEALQRGDAAEAEAQFAAAVAIDSKAGPLWRNLAHARRMLGDDAGEREALEAALAIDRTDFMAWLRKAELHQRRNEHRDAVVAWSGVLQMAAAIDPMPPSLVPVLDAARAYLAGRSSQRSDAVDHALAGRLGSMRGAAARRGGAFLDVALRGRAIHHNQCAGLHYPFLPADEFFDDAHFSWFAQLAAAAPAIRAEYEALVAGGDAMLRPYVRMEEGTPSSKWTPLDGKLSWGAAFLWEYGEPNQAVLEACPATAAALAAIPSARIAGRSPSAFFSRLAPHTRIPPHTGVTNTRAIVHLPLIVPPGCGFRVGGETRAWQEGVPFAFDDTIEHEAWNEGDEPRAVLIFDVWNPHLTPEETSLIAEYYAAVDRSDAAS